MLIRVKTVEEIPPGLSPVNVAERITALLLFYAGEADTRTPMEQAESMVKALERAGNPPQEVPVNQKRATVSACSTTGSRCTKPSAALSTGTGVPVAGADGTDTRSPNFRGARCGSPGAARFHNAISVASEFGNRRG
jgi:hypothetical protein